MKQLLSFLFVASVGLTSTWAQTTDTTTIVVHGRVIDAETKSPLKAKIKYESLPYGSKIGIFSDSVFTFTLVENKDYQLKVQAPDYIPQQLTVLAANHVEGKIDLLVELKSTGINKLIRLEKLIFELGKATITSQSHEELDELASMLNNNPNMTIQLEGHTDFRGNEKLNMKLSEDRVDAVKDYLVGKGIDKKRIQTKAFGGSQPLSRDSDAESRSKNRRVEVRILSN